MKRKKEQLEGIMLKLKDNLLNYIINQLGGNKKNSRLNNGKNLIKKYNN